MKIATALTLLLLSLTSHAQIVERVKDNSAIINGGALQLEMGEQLFTIDAAGRKTGFIKVVQLKNNRAVATILKGHVFVGQGLSLRGPVRASKREAIAAAAASADDGIDARHARNSIGFVLGYGMDSLAFTAPDGGNPSTYSESASLTGSSFNLKAFFDHPMGETFTLRALSGLDGFNGTYSAKSSTINKDGSKSSTVAITSLAIEGEAMWNFYRQSLTTVWLGLGYSFQYSISSSSNLYGLQLASSYANAVFFGAGTNIKMSPTTFFPLFVHYNYYIAGAGISQSSINLGGGWGWEY